MAAEKRAEEKRTREMTVRWQQKSERERNEGEAACERLGGRGLRDIQLAIKAVRDAAHNKGSERGGERRVKRGSQRGCEQRQSERGVRVRNTRKNLAVIL